MSLNDFVDTEDAIPWRQAFPECFGLSDFSVNSFGDSPGVINPDDKAVSSTGFPQFLFKEDSNERI